jgi:hypothetical protein
MTHDMQSLCISKFIGSHTGLNEPIIVERHEHGVDVIAVREISFGDRIIS